MDLQTLHANLSFGELSNLSIGEDGVGTIRAADHNKILLFVNQGLDKIYRRFRLLEKELTIEAQDEQYTYYLRREFAQTETQTIVPVKYIRDTVADPFIEDVVKILNVYDELAVEIPLNDNEAEVSFFTPSFDSIQIPEPVTGNAYHILYQATHPVLVPNDLTQEIILPEYLERALQAYVAYRVLAPMNGEEHRARALELNAEFMAEMGEVEDQDLASTSRKTAQGDKFEMRGFV